MKDSPHTPLANDTALAEQVLVLPGSVFFIDRIEVPIELEAAEISDYIELSLESIAPFPVDQLYWGYLYSDEDARALVYATHRDRLKKAGYHDLDSYAWVLPDFATFTGACFPSQTLVALESIDHLSLLLFTKGSRIPSTVRVTTITESIPAAAALEALKTSDTSLPQDGTTLRIRSTSSVLNEQGLAIFQHEPIEHSGSDFEYGSWAELSPSEEQLWQADVRSASFKESERNIRRLGALSLRITSWAAIFVLVLLTAELLLFGCKIWLNSLDKKISAQNPAVLTIEDQQALMVKLEQVAQNELRPVTILEKASAMRPKGTLWIEYDSATVDGENNLTIEGKAASINALNNYADSLQQSGIFEIIEGPESITRGGKTTFTVTLAYTHIEAQSSVKNDTPKTAQTAEPKEEARP